MKTQRFPLLLPTDSIFIKVCRKNWEWTHQICVLLRESGWSTSFYVVSAKFTKRPTLLRMRYHWFTVISNQRTSLSLPTTKCLSLTWCATSHPLWRAMTSRNTTISLESSATTKSAILLQRGSRSSPFKLVLNNLKSPWTSFLQAVSLPKFYKKEKSYLT